MNKQLTLPLEVKHNWGGLCNLTSSIIWAKYGYWSKGHEPPEWFDNELKLAEMAADIVQPPYTRYEVTVDSEIPGEVTGKFRCWDEANPWVEPWEVGFRFKSRESAESNYQSEYYKHKRLHEGVINALLHYKETGEPIEPDWLPLTNKNEYHWLKKDYNPKDYKGFRPLSRAS